MALPVEGPNPLPSKVLYAIMAILHLVLVGMLIYFRLGPMAKVFSRFAENGNPLPPWMTLGLTVGTFIIAAFLGLRGLRFLRGALPSTPTAPP